MLWDILIIAACVLAALAFLLAVTRSSAAKARKESNDFTGSVIAVIGTTYAVILAFMLSGVWNMLQQAQAKERAARSGQVKDPRLVQQHADRAPVNE